MIKVLNLYAGIGGNRRLWEDVKVTAVEYNKEISDIYSHFNPDDEVIVDDAHNFLLDNYQDYDFIWSSPPCPTHSKLCRINYSKTSKVKYPDMKLYEEILLLKHFYNGRWVVENVVGYYEPLIKPKEINNHYFWSNFPINRIKNNKRGIFSEKGKSAEMRDYREKLIGFNVKDLDISMDMRIKIIKNAVEPLTGKNIFDCAMNYKQGVLNG